MTQDYKAYKTARRKLESGIEMTFKKIASEAILPAYYLSVLVTRLTGNSNVPVLDALPGLKSEVKDLLSESMIEEMQAMMEKALSESYSFYFSYCLTSSYYPLQLWLDRKERWWEKSLGRSMKCCRVLSLANPLKSAPPWSSGGRLS